MNVRSIMFALFAFTLIAAVSVAVGAFSSKLVERLTVQRLQAAFAQSEHSWVTVDADGTLVHLAGEAPIETDRFRALEVAAGIVGANRIRDGIRIRPPDGDPIPEFQLEILRDGKTISIAGLIPSGTSRKRLRQAMATLGPDVHLRDLSEPVEAQPDRQWGPSLDAALVAATVLDRARISLKSCDVRITGIAESTEQRDTLVTQIKKDAGECITQVQITVPRRVISPFVFDLELTSGRTVLRDCTAQSKTERDRIEARLAAMGLPSGGACKLGLGAPSENWADAVLISIDHLGMLGRGRLVIADAEVFLEAAAGTELGQFTEVAAALDTALPDMFSIEATAPPEPVTTSSSFDGTPEPSGPEFTVTRSAEGLITLTGPMPNAAAWDAVRAYAGAQFGVDNLQVSERPAPELPDGWPADVMKGLEAMNVLLDGALTVTPERMELTGSSLVEDATTLVREMLLVALPGRAIDVRITFDAAAAQEARAPRPRACLEEMQTVLKEAQIEFSPSSAQIEKRSYPVLDKLAKILVPCGRAVFEIGGYTDNRGTDTLNLSLSKARAEAVLDGLLARGVSLEKMVSKGYGEADPIASNETEEGRAANRRIELRIVESTDG